MTKDRLLYYAYRFRDRARIEGDPGREPTDEALTEALRGSIPGLPARSEYRKIRKEITRQREAVRRPEPEQ